LFEYPQNKAAFAGMTRRPQLTVNAIDKTIGLEELAQFANIIKDVLPLGEQDYIALRKQTGGVLPEMLPTKEELTAVPSTSSGNGQPPQLEDTAVSPEDETEETPVEMAQKPQRTIEQIANEYEEQMAGLVLRASDGRLSKSEFISQMKELVTTNAGLMFRRGANIPEGDTLFGPEQVALDAELKIHLDSIAGLADSIYE